MSIIYFDCESTGLDPAKHEIWEMAYAVDDGPIEFCRVTHHGMTADETALSIGGYSERRGYAFSQGLSIDFERNLIDDLEGNTLCAANPAFDAGFLRARWGFVPCHYRLFDIEAYAMGALGHETPQGLNAIHRDLAERGHIIHEPDHTAAGDVATLRECHRVLRGIYGDLRASA